MTTDRPATSIWAKAEQERQLVRNVQEAEWRRRMLRAGRIDADQLSDQARRILAWLAEWDDWTVDGVAELLTAAHRSGVHAAGPAPASGTRRAPVPTTDRSASDPGHTRTDEPSIPVQVHVGPFEAPSPGDGAAATGSRSPSTLGSDDSTRARLAALRQLRPEKPAVGL